MAGISAPALIRLRPHRAPSVRDMAHKPADPGMPVTWMRHGGGWNGGQWAEPSSETMTGVIWSGGPVPGSVWAQLPDGSMQALKIPSAQRAAAGEGPVELHQFPVTWQRDTIRRCENLRRCAGVVAEVRTEQEYRYGRGNVPRERLVMYHADAQCQEIEHETRPATCYEPSVRDLVDLMLSADARGRSDLCRRCIYLTGPGVTEVAAA